MHGRVRQLTLVCFGSERCPDTLHQDVRRAGYDLHRAQEGNWLKADATHFNNETILFIGNDIFPHEAIASALSKHRQPRILGVFSFDGFGWNEDILRCCSDFLGWPCHQDELAFRLLRVFGSAQCAPETIDETILLEEFVALNILGESPAFVEALKLIKRFARFDAPVLLEGETGTGKELGARAIHYLSARRDHPFIAVNCGTIPDNLLESELFGHEKGAFTDARDSQPGLVEQADGGALFLDEVDTLSPKGQVALLRFIEDQRFRRLGSRSFRRVNVRVIAATNAEIQRLTETGLFRADLLFRLNVLSVKLPPLRERGNDIKLLAEAFIRQYSAQHSGSCKRLDPDTLAWMQRFDWPGNVRELQNLIHREFLLAEGPTISIVPKAVMQERRRNPHDRRQVGSFEMGFKQAKASIIENFEQRYLRWLMSESRGNISLAAERAQKDRSALAKLLKKHKIERERYATNH